LENSTHSCATRGAETASASVAETSGIRRMLFLLRWRRAASGSTSFGAALVAVNFVAVCTGIVQILTDIDEGVGVPGLRCSVRKLSDFHESGNVLLPIGTIHLDWPTVLASAFRRQQQRRGFRYRCSSLIDRQPSRVTRGRIHAVCDGSRLGCAKSTNAQNQAQSAHRLILWIYCAKHR